jgi:uncharacterized protein (DUF934 family)
MALIKNGEVALDEWVRIADGETLPPGRPAIVSLTRWLDEKTALRGHNAPLGLHLTAADDPGTIADDVPRFGLIAIDFPAFTDGRGYSTARLLRERLGFSGELRAVGNVLRDQFLFMHRCGFDAFEVAQADAAQWREAIGEFHVWYQPTGDGRVAAPAMRQRAAAAE